ncbi:MAG TPA: hypothetical protein VI978_02485 [Candidatus Paceibacterota bacterium]
MKLKIVECPCDNKNPHRKFQAIDGSGESEGFFSIGEGRLVLEALEKLRIVTLKEAQSVQKELLACGLDENRSDPTLKEMTVKLTKEYPPELHEKVITANLEGGLISEVEAEKIRNFLKNPTQA